MNEHLEKQLQHCIEYATDLLVETGEAYPFGAFLDTVNQVHPLEMEIDKKNVPTLGKVVSTLEKYCKTEMASNNITGYALCYEVGYKLSEEEEEQTAIAIEMHYKEENQSYTFYLPFTKNDDEVIVNEVFGVK